tara:strand:+ start:206916 stop:207509 length:594 start_codon:yes stop_codon:yes gene_type:complete
MLPHRLVAVPFALTLLLQACSTAPVQTSVSAEPAAATPAETQSAKVPELKLNLPQQASCDCTPPEAADYTFLEKGYRALLNGDYGDAMEYFLRYQRLESSPRAQLESGIAITYVQMLPRSSFYNPQVARSAFSVLRNQNAKELKVHEYTRLMRQSLINFLELQDEINKLKTSNASLQENLKKREEALKRLRDLTLSQ